MLRHVRFGLLAVGLVALPIIASAQTRVAPAVRSSWHPMPMARPAAARTVATPTRPIIVRIPVASTNRQGETTSAATNATNFSVFPNGTFGFASAATSLDLNQLLNNVPGLGFDYSHVAALNGNLGERAFIDPVTQQDIALAEQLSRSTPAFSGGFIPFWGGYGDSQPVVEEEPQSQQQPQVIVLQQPVPVPQSASRPSPQAAPAEQQSQLPDVGEFTLVLHDGTKIKAVAFSRQDDQIVYITSDGVRNSFPVSDLDATATQQLNQQHGTPLHLSL